MMMMWFWLAGLYSKSTNVYSLKKYKAMVLKSVEFAGGAKITIYFAKNYEINSTIENKYQRS